MTERRSSVRIARGERAIWQRRFWEHVIRDERDYVGHVDYCHINPVKHRYVERVAHWPYSTFRRYVELGVYAPNGPADQIWRRANEREPRRFAGGDSKGQGNAPFHIDAMVSPVRTVDIASD